MRVPYVPHVPYVPCVSCLISSHLVSAFIISACHTTHPTLAPEVLVLWSWRLVRAELTPHLVPLAALTGPAGLSLPETTQIPANNHPANLTNRGLQIFKRSKRKPIKLYLISPACVASTITSHQYTICCAILCKKTGIRLAHYLHLHLDPPPPPRDKDTQKRYRKTDRRLAGG